MPGPRTRSRSRSSVVCYCCITTEANSPGNLIIDSKSAREIYIVTTRWDSSPDQYQWNLSSVLQGTVFRGLKPRFFNKRWIPGVRSFWNTLMARDHRHKKEQGNNHRLGRMATPNQQYSTRLAIETRYMYVDHRVAFAGSGISGASASYFLHQLFIHGYSGAKSEQPISITYLLQAVQYWACSRCLQAIRQPLLCSARNVLKAER